MVEADLEEVGGELDEGDVGPRRRLEDKLLPRFNGPWLALCKADVGQWSTLSWKSFPMEMRESSSSRMEVVR